MTFFIEEAKNKRGEQNMTDEPMMTPEENGTAVGEISAEVPKAPQEDIPREGGAPDGEKAPERKKSRKKIALLCVGGVVLLTGVALLICLWAGVFSHRTYDLFSDNGLLLVQRNGYYGYVDKKGEEVIPCVYTEATPFCNGYAVIQEKSDGSYFYINTKGEKVIDLPFYTAEEFDSHGRAVVRRHKDTFELIDKKGKTVFSADSLMSYDNGYYVYGEKKGDITVYGIIDARGKTVLPAKYDGIRFLIDTEKTEYGKDLIVVTTKTISDSFDALLTVRGKELFRTELGGKIGYACQNERIRFSKKTDGNALFGYINKKGEAVVSADYEEASDFCGGLACVTENGKQKVIGTDGKEIFSLAEGHQIEAIDPDGYLLECVDIGGKQTYGILNKQGGVSVPAIYDGHIFSAYGNAGLTHLFDGNGNTVLSKGETCALVKKGGKILNEKYAAVLYRLLPGKKDLYLAATEADGNQWDCLDGDGNVLFSLRSGVAPAIETYVFPVSDDGYIVVKDTVTNTYGVVDATGKTVVPFIYDSIYSYYGLNQK